MNIFGKKKNVILLPNNLDKGTPAYMDPAIKPEWIVAVPRGEAYRNMSRKEAIQKYRKMFEEFDAQFTTLEGTQNIDEKITLHGGCRYIPSFRLKRMAMCFKMGAYGSEPMNAMVFGYVKTRTDGYPAGEAACVLSASGNVDVINKFYEFYKKHNWYPIKWKEFSTVDPRTRTLDDIDNILHAAISWAQYGARLADFHKNAGK